MYNLYNQTDVTNLKQALENLKAEIEAQQRREKARLDEAYKQGQLSGYTKAQQDLARMSAHRNGGGY